MHKNKYVYICVLYFFSFSQDTKYSAIYKVFKKHTSYGAIVIAQCVEHFCLALGRSGLDPWHSRWFPEPARHAEPRVTNTKVFLASKQKQTSKQTKKSHIISLPCSFSLA